MILSDSTTLVRSLIGQFSSLTEIGPPSRVAREGQSPMYSSGVRGVKRSSE
jgi:hypothetical protein